MIKKLSIENFQAHKNAELELSSAVNVIKGQTHSGKSSIIRALRWLLQNRPQGEGFVSTFAKPKDGTVVEAVFDDTEVSRVKTSTVNGYEIDGKELKAIRSDVPSAVVDAFKMSEINLQTQDEPYFLLGESSGEVARKLNAFVGLSIIDSSQRKINSIITTTKDLLHSTINRLETVNEQLKNMRWLRKAESEVRELEEIRDRSNLLTSEIKELKNFQDSIRNTNAKILVCKTTLLAKADIEKALKQKDTIKALEDELSELKHLKEMLNRQTEAKRRAVEEAETAAGALDVFRKKLKICPLCGGKL